ncbi:MAG: cell envelope integrity protein CreD [Pseudomonadota bacterium]
MPLPALGLLARHQGTLKLAVIGLIVLLSLYPLHRIHEIVRERQATSHQVEQEIAEVWGGAQEIVGPILAVPIALDPQGVMPDPNGRGVGQKPRTLFVLPESLTIDSRIEPEVRARGIYEAILYRSQSAFSGSFGRPDLGALGLEEEDLQWDQAWLEVRISDLRGLVDVQEVTWNDAALELGLAAPGRPAVTAALPASGAAEGTWPARFAITLSLNGSQALAFLPLGQQSEVALASPWPHPSFAGDLLPGESTIDGAGFTARWSLSRFHRSLADAWVQSADDPGALLKSANLRQIAVRLVEPVNHYLMSERSVKYGLLFVALVSAVLFVFEAVAGARVHPVQYVMVAAALCLFFLLLLSLSEVIGFSAGYAVAAGLTTTLLAGYVTSVLKSRRRGAALGGLLLLVYGTLYLTLRSEDHALLLGSSLLFVALALAMFATRKIDWYALGPDRILSKQSDA